MKKKNIIHKEKAQLWDVLQKVSAKFNDHTTHTVIYLDGKIDLGILQETAKQLTDEIPILKSCFVEKFFNKYWIAYSDFDPRKIIRVFNIDSYDDVEKHIVYKIDEYQAPQIYFNVLRHKDGDVLCMMVNHMIADGAALKKLLGYVSLIYTSLCKDSNYVFKYTGSHVRSFNTLFKELSPKGKVAITTRISYSKAIKDREGFPFELDSTHHSELEPYIVKSKLEAEDFINVRSQLKILGYTINDAVIAAFLRRLMDRSKTKNGIDMDIIADLRRYLADPDMLGITNYVSKIQCNLGDDIGSNYLETLDKVAKLMSKSKNNFPGLEGIILLLFCENVMPYKLVKFLYQKLYKNPKTAISNIGVINDKEVYFNNMNVKDVYMTGSIKYPPYSQLALTTFKNSITFTIAIFGTSKDYEVATDILNDVVKHLKSVII